MKPHDVKVTRDGRWWMIEIPALDGLTQTRRLDQVEMMAREYIAVTVDVPLSTVVVSVSRIEVDGQDILATKVLVDALRARATEAEQKASLLTRQFAEAMTAAGVPVRDVSEVLGLSHQRVSQIVRSSPEPEEATLARVLLAAREAGGADSHVPVKHAPHRG
jgi:transcriptional regulator with XRE-family HTH domain